MSARLAIVCDACQIASATTALTPALAREQASKRGWECATYGGAHHYLYAAGDWCPECRQKPTCNHCGHLLTEPLHALTCTHCETQPEAS